MTSSDIEISELKNTVKDLRTENQTLRANQKNLVMRNSILYHRLDLPVERTRLHDEVVILQAKIDALMIEYCYDDMSSTQLANWKANQRKVNE